MHAAFLFSPINYYTVYAKIPLALYEYILPPKQPMQCKVNVKYDI